MAQVQARNLLNDKNYIKTKKDEQILDPTSVIYKRITYHFKFKKRTFKLDASHSVSDENQVEWGKIDLDEVKIKLQERCRHCNG